jgi:hypothetical protein
MLFALCVYLLYMRVSSRDCHLLWAHAMLFPLWESLALSQSEAKGVVKAFGERVCRSTARGGVFEVEMFVLEVRSTDVERSYEGLESWGRR